MQASNQTYKTFFSNPGSGTGTPHFKSLVMPRSFSPVFSHDSVIIPAFLDQAPFLIDDAVHSSIRGCNSSSLRWICVVSRTTGVAPSTLHLGLIKLRGSRRLPHLSH